MNSIEVKQKTEIIDNERKYIVFFIKPSNLYLLFFVLGIIIGFSANNIYRIVSKNTKNMTTNNMMENVEINGIITNELGIPLDSIMVIVGDSSIITSNNGYFSFSVNKHKYPSVNIQANDLRRKYHLIRKTYQTMEREDSIEIRLKSETNE